MSATATPQVDNEVATGMLSSTDSTSLAEAAVRVAPVDALGTTSTATTPTNTTTAARQAKKIAAQRLQEERVGP